MKRIAGLAALSFALLASTVAVQPADACGVKLTVKSRGPR